MMPTRNLAMLNLIANLGLATTDAHCNVEGDIWFVRNPLGDPKKGAFRLSGDRHVEIWAMRPNDHRFDPKPDWLVNAFCSNGFEITN